LNPFLIGGIETLNNHNAVYVNTIVLPVGKSNHKESEKPKIKLTIAIKTPTIKLFLKPNLKFITIRVGKIKKLEISSDPVARIPIMTNQDVNIAMPI
jgi:hypothetical protein